MKSDSSNDIRSFLVIALYDPEKPASLGGRIVGYRIQDNSDDIVIEEIPASSREGICKVKCIAYKES